MMINNINHPTLFKMTVDMVYSYLSNKTGDLDNLSSVFTHIYQALSQTSTIKDEVGQRTNKPPAVPISESVTDDYIVCLEDGKKMQMLKRHLTSLHKVSVDDYKKRWGLDDDYPSVAPSYAKRRSLMAKHIGLGVTTKHRTRR